MELEFVLSPIILFENFFDIKFSFSKEINTKLLSISFNPVSIIPEILNFFILGIILSFFVFGIKISIFSLRFKLSLFLIWFEMSIESFFKFLVPFINFIDLFSNMNLFSIALINTPCFYCFQ